MDTTLLSDLHISNKQIPESASSKTTSSQYSEKLPKKLVETSTETSTEKLSGTELWSAYQVAKSEQRMLFPLEGATQFKVSELELMLASPHSVYLGTDCKTMLKELTTFEQVESIVRNEFAVHEKIGQLENLKLGEHMGIALNVGGLDWRLFMHQWQHMIAVSDGLINHSKTNHSKTNHSNPSYSIQFYDGQGRAICKVFLRDYSEDAIYRWQVMVEKYALTDTDLVIGDVEANSEKNVEEVLEIDENKITSILQSLSKTPERPLWQYKALESEDLDTLQSEWLGLTDVHQFHFLLKKLSLDRASSYRQAPDGYTQQLQNNAIEHLLMSASVTQDPIMIFVGNSGMVQIQTGAVHHVKRMGEWLNILDKKDTNFTLHLNDSALSQVWCVKRPTKDGIVTCVEGFDKYGNSIVTFFGQRTEGQPEQDYWQALVADLPILK